LRASSAGRPNIRSNCSASCSSTGWAAKSGSVSVRCRVVSSEPAVAASASFGLSGWNRPAAMAAVMSRRARGASPRRLGYCGDPVKLARYKHDHDAVNELLAQSLPEALDRLERVYGCPMTTMLGRRTRRHAVRLMLNALQRWRELVWTNVVEMLHAPDEQARHRVVTRMERRSRRIGHRLRAVHAMHLVLRLAGPIMDTPSRTQTRAGLLPEWTST
jgi:Family of unknown function (DUF5995)